MKMSMTKLMQKVEDGDIEIDAWADNDEDVALVTIFKSNGTSRRATIEVTGVAAYEQRALEDYEDDMMGYAIG